MALAAIYLIWGTTYLAVVIMLRTIPPFAGSAMRYTFGGTLLLLWLLLFRRQAFAGLPWRRLLLAGVLLVAGGNGFAVWAQQGVPSGIAALLISSVPVFVMLLNWLFFARRAPDVRSLIGILIGMCGVAVIVVHLHTLSGAVRMPYVLALLGAMLCWSSGTLVSRGTIVAAQVSAGTCVQMLVGATLLSLMALVHGDWRALFAAHVAPGLLAGARLPDGVRQHRRVELFPLAADAGFGAEGHHLRARQPAGCAAAGLAAAGREDHGQRRRGGAADPGSASGWCCSRASRGHNAALCGHGDNRPQIAIT